MTKRNSSARNESSRPDKKRARLSPNTSTTPIVIEDDSDDELPAILARIKELEDSEKLARQLQEGCNEAGSSRNAIVVLEDEDEAFARRLAKEWEETDRSEFTGISESSSGVFPPQKTNPSPRDQTDDNAPDERLAQYRDLFTKGRSCTKCGQLVPSPRGFVMLSGDTISPSLGSLLHAPCTSCKTNHCRGCFRSTSCPVSCKGKAKHPTCTVHACCAEGRAIAIFEALGGFDRQYLGERATSQSRVLAATKSIKAGKSKSVGPGGTGYGADETYGAVGRWAGSQRNAGLGASSDAKRNKELAAHWDELVIRALRMLTELLPSPYIDNPHIFDMLPHPSIGPLLSLSKLTDLLGDLLRNDSVSDWTARSEIYNAMLALLTRMSDCELTVRVLLEPRREMSESPGLECWMWDEGEISWVSDKEGQFEKAPPLYDYFKKLNKQCEAFLTGAARLLDSDENAEETIKATSLCGDFIAARDDMERAMSVLGVSLNGNDDGQSNCKGEGMSKDTSVENAYNKACEKLAFRHETFLLGEESSEDKKKVAAYNYAKDLKGTENSTRNPKGRLHLVKELAVMATSLPPGVWVRVDEVRNDAIKILIAGPEGTPYAGGLFEFDCFMPINYPSSPPQMHLRTTGGGTVRFNPNLYNNGKVCLSLLGTWAGRPEEQWSPYNSTLLQVLVSIQSMILIDLPYFNEPGFGKANAKSAESIEYNKDTSLQTVRWAIIDWLHDEHRHGIWGDVICSHFSIKETQIRKQIEVWASKDARAEKSASGGLDLLKEFDNGVQRIQKWRSSEGSD